MGFSSLIYKFGSKFARKKAASASSGDEPADPPSGDADDTDTSSDEPKEKKPGKLRRAWNWSKRKAAGGAGWVADKAPEAGGALGSAAKGGAAVGGVIIGGGRAALGGGWRVTKGLFTSIDILLITALLLHAYDLKTYFENLQTRGLLLILFAVYAWLFIYSKYEGGFGDIKALIKPLGISAVAFFVPLFLRSTFFLNITHLNDLIATIISLAPIWPLVIMFGMPTTRLSKWLRISYIILILLAFVPSFWYSISNDFNIQTMRVGGFGVMYDTWDNVKKGGGYVYDSVAGIPGQLKKTAEKQIQYAVGDYYTGQVEDSKNQQIGVYIENVEPVTADFYADDTVIVWATLLAKTLDPEKQIEIKATCWGEKRIGDELKKEQGDADPSSDNKEFVLQTAREEERYITCEFPPKFFDMGPKNIFVDADFNFQTMSYLKTYFMNLETLRAMKRSGIDPFDQYKITDKNPPSVCTNGPINLNIKTSEMPIGVSTSEPVDIKLGITLENAWQGKLKKANDITIKIPDAMEITYCDHAFEKVSCTGDECEDGKYISVYKIKKQKTGGKMGLDDIKEVAGYHSIACRLKVNDMNRLLGNYPLISTFFKVTADYEYGLEKMTSVNIKEALGGGKGTDAATQQQKAASFTYRPTSSPVTVKIGQQKEFSVTITNPGSISYGWQSQGVKEETWPDVTSYAFSSDKAGDAKVIFSAISSNGTKVEEKAWDVKVVEEGTT
ncbi:hypothetical protein COV19_00550 [Candidatus Woesearchaeota archaeon CG10_big_fil_rev_8_21_14_0_10_44_13]|nr:MAG: hypothetical protein COV19_00550 [Candidatus Woesearchaeota archaeon CG10_big_fil_rev_8_21_14_0_10_44_13]